MTNKHWFLIGRDGDGLSPGAREVPAIREYVEGLPETAKTFTLNHVDAVDDPSGIGTEIVEFAGAWPLHDVHRNGTGRRVKYVNPNYVHAGRISDIVVECGCGALQTRARNDAKYALLRDDNHHEGCMPFDRHRARADMSERRYEEIKRLTALGWRGPRIAKRFGVSANDVGSLAKQFGLSLRGLRKRYKRRAAATYSHLLDGELGEDVAVVYGHSLQTISRWAGEYRADGDASDMPAGGGGSAHADD